ncbi:MAG: hypothetical protein AAFN43_07325 [Pseudomonadota bacterium]
MPELLNYLITNIMALEPIVRWPGLILIGFFCVKALGHLFGLRLISSLTNFLYALIIALVLARYGQGMTEYLLDLLKRSQET